MVGLDGFSLDIILNLLKQKSFTNFQRIAKKCFGRLLIEIPPITPTSWTSLITGVNPARHGIWGFTKLYIDEEKTIAWRPYSSYDVKSPRLFEMTALYRIKSIVVNYSLTYPINGLYLANNIIVSDMHIGPKVQFHPSILSERYSQYFTLDDDVSKKTQMMCEGVLKLTKEFSWNLLISVLRAPDELFHKEAKKTLKVRGKAREVFLIIDEFLGEIRELSDILIIVSDHGLSFYRKLVNPLFPLYAHKILKEKEDLFNKSVKNLISIIYSSKVFSLIHSFVRTLVSSEKTPLCFFIPKNSLEDDEILIDRVDPQDTWIIYFKRQDLLEKCYNILKESSALFRVYKLEELFEGPNLPNLPALIVVPKYKEGVYLFFDYPELFSRVSTLYMYSRAHHPYGVFISYGKEIRQSRKFSEFITPYDLVPTILSLFNLPIPSKTDGRVLPLLSSVVRKYKKRDYSIAVKIAKLKSRLRVQY